MGREVTFELRHYRKMTVHFCRAGGAAWPQNTGTPGESLELNRCKFARLADGAM